MTKTELQEEITKTNKIIQFYKDELDELESQYPNGIPDHLHYEQQDLILNYINKRDELQSEIDSLLNSEYMQTQFRLLHQIKREIHNWENYEKQKEQGSSLFNDDYDIYQIMLNLSQEFVENFNNKNK